MADSVQLGALTATQSDIFFMLFFDSVFGSDIPPQHLCFADDVAEYTDDTKRERFLSGCSRSIQFTGVLTIQASSWPVPQLRAQQRAPGPS